MSWEEEFRPLLGKSTRWEGFKRIMADQLGREKCFILETGTLREPGNWRGDGQSTRLWQWLIENHQAFAISVDADVKACMLASRECPNVRVELGDSVAFMRGFMPFPLTLVYLDSIGGMHQLAELAALWEKIPSGCLIASDDSPKKPELTRKLLSAMGIEPEYDDYIVVWRKP